MQENKYARLELCQAARVFSRALYKAVRKSQRTEVLVDNVQ